LSRSGDQRRHERFPSNLTIKFARGEGAVRDISAGGIYFITDVPLRAGQELNFTLRFPDAAGGPISATCTARVMRVERLGARYGIGASISRVDFRRLPRRHS